jgi:hypothetical protein
MKTLFYLLFFIFITNIIQAQKPKWSEWKSYDTLKCDSIKIIPIPENAIVIKDWAYSNPQIIVVNQMYDGKFVLYIAEQDRVNVKTGIMQKSNLVDIEEKDAFNLIKENFEIVSKKKHKHTHNK